MVNDFLNGLEGYWKLEEGATGPYVDETSNNNDLTEDTSVMSATGILGNGLENDTSGGDGLKIADEDQTNLDFDVGTGWTLSFWIKPLMPLVLLINTFLIGEMMWHLQCGFVLKRAMELQPTLSYGGVMMGLPMIIYILIPKLIQQIGTI